MLPRVSIIVPIYNVEPYVEECIQSVMRQSYGGMIECILVDDCGTDKSMEIAERLVAEYEGPIEFRVLHHEKNQGLSAARNTGIDVARGEYVYFLDSDDWISDDCIERLTQPLGFEKYDFVVGHYERDGRDRLVSYPEGEYHDFGLRRNGYRGRGLKKTYRKKIPVSSCNKLFRKAFLIENQLLFEVGKVQEDSIFSFDLACIERKFYVVNAITYHYRRRENSISTCKNQFVKIVGLVGFFQSIKDRVRQDKYKSIDGIYNHYMFYLKKVFRWISTVEMDETTLAYVQKETKGFLDIIPNIRYLDNKHDRLIYFFCKKDQTYLRYQYIMQRYPNRLSGRIIRNLLNLIPPKKVKHS